MNKQTRSGFEILGTAGLIGVLGNLLLRQTPWGLNAFLFVTVFTVAMIVLTKRHRPELMTVRTIALQAAMVFFATMFLIRDSIELRVFDTIAILIIMGILVLPNFRVDQRIAGVFHYAAGFIWSGIMSAFGAIAILGADIDWKEIPGNRISKTAFSVLRGLAIALPIFFVFGALFMAADAAFENFANRIVSFDLGTAVSHVMITSVLAWLTAGYYRGTLVESFARAAASPTAPIPRLQDQAKKPNAGDSTGRESFVDKFTAESTPGPPENGPLPNNATVLEHINKNDDPNDGARVDNATTANIPSRSTVAGKRDWQNWDNTKLPSVFTLGTVETVIILGLIDMLFVSFVVFQLPYLFGGMEFVQNTPDLKLADFARRGFGELVTVAFLVLPILLATHWLLRRDTARNESIFRVLAGIQIGLLFVIMTSAMQRLILLTGELGYGWTTVRFYPMVVMIWLAVVFVWFGWTVLRGRRNNFAWGALWSAIVILGASNLINPDAFIASRNIQLAQQGRDYDAHYNTTLSSDAIPAILAGLQSMDLDDQCQTKLALHLRYRELGRNGDIRSLNWSRKAAWHSLNQNDKDLHQVEGCPSWINENLKLDDTEQF